MTNVSDKPVIIDEMKISGIYASSNISKKTGFQNATILCNGKTMIVRNFYPTPDANRVIPGTMVTVTISEIEWIMSDFNSMNIGSREFKIAPAASISAAEKKAA